MNRPNAFDFLYAGNRRECKSLGDDYRPPEQFEHGKETLVATLPKAHPNSDGFDVEVYEIRLPATFWRVVAKPTKNSMGELQPGWEMSTGSGGEEMLALVGCIARLASEGMVGFGPHTN